MLLDGFSHLRHGPQYLSGGRAPGPPEEGGAEPRTPGRGQLMLLDRFPPIRAAARSVYPGAEPLDAREAGMWGS
jgi:hypothetical protein